MLINGRLEASRPSGLHFAPNLGQGIGGLATFTIPKAARIKDVLKDRLQAIDQCLLTHPVVDRGYAQWPCLAGGSPFRNLQSSHGLRLIGALAELLMEPFQILIQTGLEFLDGHLICAACTLIGANALPRKLQVREYTLSTREWTFCFRPSRTR